MAKQLFVRFTGAVGLLALATLLVGLDPFLGPSAGASPNHATPAVAVDRSLKGDRLPIQSPRLSADLPDWRYEFAPQAASSDHAELPIGCDPAFSPITSPALKNVYRRCMT